MYGEERHADSCVRRYNRRRVWSVRVWDGIPQFQNQNLLYYMVMSSHTLMKLYNNNARSHKVTLTI